MDPALAERRRRLYRYPPAKLNPRADRPRPPLPGRHYDVVDPLDAGWPADRGAFTSRALDAHHHRLLHSDTGIDRFDGVISVVFWGHFADRRGQRTGIAPARARWVFVGKNGSPRNGIHFISRRVADARAYLQSNPPQLLAALQALDDIDYIGLSFASKILAFMDPARCAVLDSVILEALSESKSAHLRAITGDPVGFERWCTRCRRVAESLNRQGSRWADWDGERQRWRAVDVERAVFHHAAVKADPADLLV